MYASFLKSATQKEQYPTLDLPKVVFAGRSNVGKSSLINSLLGTRKLAKTSSRPGHTQLINFYNVDEKWVFVDLPGYGFARAPQHIRDRWGPMIEEFLENGKRLSLAILILDARRTPRELDFVMRDYLTDLAIPFSLVVTKVDKLSKQKRVQAVRQISEAMEVDQVVPYSSATGVGKKHLWRVIREV